MANARDEVDVDRLLADPRAIDEMNQAVISEFRANQGRVSGAMEGMPILLLSWRQKRAHSNSPAMLFARRRSPSRHRLFWGCSP